MKLKLLAILILILLSSGCVKESNKVDKELCENSGGKWNECGSPCAGTGAEFCVEVCNAQCECNDEYKCPENYKCRITNKDEFGVCIKE